MKKLETKSTVLLKHHLKALKLPTMHAECEKIAARCAKENVDHLGFLLQLCEQELLDREKRAAERRLKLGALLTAHVNGPWARTAGRESHPLKIGALLTAHVNCRWTRTARTRERTSA